MENGNQKDMKINACLRHFSELILSKESIQFLQALMKLFNLLANLGSSQNT